MIFERLTGFLVYSMSCLQWCKVIILDELSCCLSPVLPISVHIEQWVFLFSFGEWIRYWKYVEVRTCHTRIGVPSTVAVIYLCLAIFFSLHANYFLSFYKSDLYFFLWWIIQGWLFKNCHSLHLTMIIFIHCKLSLVFSCCG